MFKKLVVKTTQKRELVDMTDQVEAAIAQSKTKDSLLCVFAKHTTCAVVISELEDDLAKDILNYLEKESPKGPFRHSHAGISHTPAHLLSAIIGQSATIPVKNSKIQLGTWQRICLLELDGPREREIIVQSLP